MAVDASSQRVDVRRAGALDRLKDRAGSLLTRINEHRVMLIAAGVTYYLLLALVPTLTIFVTLYGLFNDPKTVSDHVNLLAGIVPGGALQIVQDQLTRLTATPRGALSLTLLASLVVALWSSSSGVKAMFEAMNVAYEVEEKRNFLVLNGLALLFTFGGVVAAVVTIGAVVVIPIVLKFFFMDAGFDWLVTGLGYLVMLAVLVGAIGTLYRWGPSRHRGKWHWLSPGTMLTIVAILVVSILFSWYTANFGNYNATYGSLGALVGFMTWMWLTVTVLIVGAELNAEAEHGPPSKASSKPRDSSPQAPQQQVRPGLLTLAVVLPAALLLSWFNRPR